jgi:dTDP-4-dehydrorhamnose 3,5-epimerase
VIRGVHFADVPPGQAKYVYCTRGALLDVVVDIRVGSPTYGMVEAVELDAASSRAAYLAEGLGHAFVALEDDTVMCYLLSRSYVAADELSLSVFDPTIALPLPADIDPVLSERDRLAPTLAETHAAGLLPEYTMSRRLDETLSAGVRTTAPL